MARHLAIGDVHGCYTALRTLCDYVGLRDDDTIVLLGDYVNRGPNAHAAIDWILHLMGRYDVKPLRGNHDVMMVAARDGDAEYRRWIDYGGDATLRSYAVFDGDPGALADVPKTHWDFLENRLLRYYETPTHFYVHANAYPDVPLADQPDSMLYWEKFDDPPLHESGKIMICGHTSQKSGLPKFNPHAVCIDTRVYDSGWLTCLHVETGALWQANERAATRTFSLASLRRGDSP